MWNAQSELGKLAQKLCLAESNERKIVERCARRFVVFSLSLYFLSPFFTHSYSVSILFFYFLSLYHFHSFFYVAQLYFHRIVFCLDRIVNINYSQTKWKRFFFFQLLLKKEKKNTVRYFMFVYKNVDD